MLRVYDLMLYIKHEFPGTLDSHFHWDLLENILGFAQDNYQGQGLERFLLSIIPEITAEELSGFIT